MAPRPIEIWGGWSRKGFDFGRLVSENGAGWVMKKAQKTPEREIALAEQRKRDHLRRRK